MNEESEVHPSNDPNDSAGWGADFVVMESESTPHRVELRRLANQTRELIEILKVSRAPIEAVTKAADIVEQALGELRDFSKGQVYEGFFAEVANAGGSPHAFFDHSPIVGVANPLASPIKLAISNGVVHGKANFGPAYEGPPGHVHGGFIAASFDEVLGMAQSLGGAPGMTGTLTIKYRSPTPLNTDLRFEATLDKQEGRKQFTSGRLYKGDILCAEAQGLFISVDFSKFAKMMADSQESQK